MQTLVLASSSKYRHKILKKLHLDFVTCSSTVDESPTPNEPANGLAVRLSIAKAQAAIENYPNHLIIGSDQVATFDGQLIGKPGNYENAFQQLKMQSGQKVSFYTGICVLDSATGNYLSDVDRCDVYFRKLNDSQIQRYLEIEQPFGCAGSFKSEDYGISLFSKIQGEDPNALIGLPLIKLIKLLDQYGLKIP